MKNHPSNDHYQKTLSFFRFASGDGMGSDDVSVLRMWLVRLLSKSLPRLLSSSRTAHREAAFGPIFEWNAVSRYDVDDYGRPRILSRWEVILHALALPAIAGVMIGFGLAIALLAVHNDSTPKPQGKVSQPQVAFLDAEP